MSLWAPLFLGYVALLSLVKNAESTSCAFYCFVLPTRKETFDVAAYQNLSCTHFVYGFSRIRSDMSLHSITSRDNLEIMSPGNLRKFLGLRNMLPDATLLLGIQMTASDIFHDTRHARRTGELINNAARKRHFDGVFVRMEGRSLESSLTQHFLSALSLTPASTSSPTTLAITPRWMWRLGDRIHELVDHVEHIYLDMQELPSSEDTYSVSHIDPLLPSESIPLEDTISGSTDRMLTKGVPAEKIIIGLSSGGRSYRVLGSSGGVNTMGVKEMEGFLLVSECIRSQSENSQARRRRNEGGYSPITAGPLPLSLLVLLVFTDERAASAVILDRFNWTSANFPKQQSLGRKIEWTTQEGLGGIGISSLQFDDPKGKCGAGSYPSHTMIGQMLKCRLKEHHRRPPAQCTRLCYLDDSAEGFDPRALQPHWCSHFVVGPADIQLTDMVELSPSTQEVIANIDRWMQDSEGKPAEIVLSIGARQTSDVWRMELGTVVKRMNLISNIRKVLLKVNASAVVVSWTLGALDSALDPSLLSKFVEDLRDALPKVSTPFCYSASHHVLAKLFEIASLQVLFGQPPCSCETL
ncbi:unnamed protein product [Heligmosomoides polygyrus]|uniref:Glyco_hydro_18 domain-containing protein n=1 Tax=Heligmosomoides polygyrus TaxID=6339 RepID=A0A183F798_HELPZ|nr:unnamed protein product [Heligmosomoides polygyrus]